MADERKRIDVETVARIAQENAEAEYTEIGWYGETIQVKRRLNVAEMMAFVSALANNCFAENGDYIPEAYDFTRRSLVLELYGNLVLPEDVVERYDVISGPACAEAIDAICSVIDARQLADIEHSAKRRIDYRINSDIAGAKREVNELIAKLSEMVEQFGELFDGFSADDVKGLMESLANGVDEEKLLDAYVKQLKDAEAGDGGDV